MQGHCTPDQVPIAGLRNIRDLTYKTVVQPGSVTAWSTAWGELTALTRLAIRGLSRTTCLLPDSLPDVTSLQHLEITLALNYIVITGPRPLLRIVEGLPLLKRLVVKVVDTTPNSHQKLSPGAEACDTLCLEVSLEVPEMVYTPIAWGTDPDVGDYALHFKSRLAAGVLQFDRR